MSLAYGVDHGAEGAQCGCIRVTQIDGKNHLASHHRRRIRKYVEATDCETGYIGCIVQRGSQSLHHGGGCQERILALTAL